MVSSLSIVNVQAQVIEVPAVDSSVQKMDSKASSLGQKEMKGAMFKGQDVLGKDSAERDAPMADSMKEKEKKTSKRQKKKRELKKPKVQLLQSVGVEKQAETPLVVEWINVKRAELSQKNQTSKQLSTTTLNEEEVSDTEAGNYVPITTRLQTMSPAPKSEQQDWEVRYRDVSIRKMLQRWAQDAQYQLIWESSRDFPIELEVVIHGDFRDGVGTVMESLSQTDYPVQALINSALRQVRVVRYLKGQAK
jgi:hypothetical protein